MQIKRTTVWLGEQEYEIAAAPLRRARAWRAQLHTALAPLFDLLRQSGTIRFEQVDDVAALLDQVMPTLLAAFDTVFALLVAYDPALAADRDYLEEHATDEQVITAFLEVLKLAFPLGLLTQLLGPVSRVTLPNSPAPSGESTVPTLTT